MSTLTDPASTPPGEMIDIKPLRVALEDARATLHYRLAARWGHLSDSDREAIQEALDAAEAADAAWAAAVDHNKARRLTAEQGIAEARQELTKAVARANGYEEPRP